MEFLNQWVLFALYFLAIMGLVGFSGLLLNRLKVSENTSRRVVHIGVGLMVSSSPFLFDDARPAILLAVIFIILNWLALIKDKAQGMHSTQRKSYGTVYFPLSFLVLILLFWESNPAALILGMLLMTLSDPFASFVGESRFGGKSFTPWQDKKSPGGTLAAFCSNFLLVFFLLPLFFPLQIPSLFIISFNVAIVGMLAEIISREGTDNLSLPLFSALMLDLSVNTTFSGQFVILFWILFSALLAGTAYHLKSLSVSGFFGALFMGSIMFSLGGVQWMAPMAAFFILSSLISKIGKVKKRSASLMAEKHDVRDIYQVYANGGIGFVCVILFYFSNNDLFYVAYLASLASAAADTWATEFGTLLGKYPRKITNFQSVLPGESGGITLTGTLASILGAFSIGLTGYILSSDIDGKIFALIVLAGFSGALIDSILGATIQAQYRCPHCQKITEKQIHCGEYTTQLQKGIRPINNDVINLLCTLSGALIAFFVLWI